MIGKVTSKGQVTLPKEVREKLNIGLGDRIDFIIKGNSVIIRSLKGKVNFSDLKGMLSTRKKVSDEEIHQAKEIALSKKWPDTARGK